MNIITTDRKTNIRRILTLVLWSIWFFLMIMVARDLYQNFKDIHYHIASICLIALAMLVKNNFRLNFYSLIPAGGGLLGGINYIYDTRFDWGREYKLVLLSKYCLMAVCIVWIISVLSQQKITELKWKKSFNTVIFIIFAIVASVLKYKYAYYFLIPIILLVSIGRIETSVIKEQINVMAVALFANFFLLMTTSLILSPGRSDSGRYEGIFYFPVVIGLLSAMGIISLLYFLTETLASDNNLLVSSKKKNVVIITLLLIYPLFTLLYSGDRSVMLGIMVIAIVFIVYFIGRCKKKTRIVLSIAITFFIIALGGTVVWMSKTFDVWEYVEEHNINSNSIGYYFIVHLPAYRERNNTGVFEPGTIWASLDAMSSDRLGIWVTGLKKVTLFGKNDLSIILPTGENAGHIHSTYIYWLLNYGILGGGLGILWMCSVFISRIGLFLKKERYNILPICFTMLAFGMFWVEKQTFEEMLPMLMIIFEYRYFYDVDECDSVEIRQRDKALE